MKRQGCVKVERIGRTGVRYDERTTVYGLFLHLALKHLKSDKIPSSGFGIKRTQNVQKSTLVPFL